MFDRIVVGFDGFEGGQDAIALAGLLGAESADIVVLGAFPHGDSAAYGAPPAYADSIRQEGLASIAAALPNDPRFRARAILDWSAGRALHQAADEEHADLIVLGSDHNGPIGRIVLGDISRRTLHGARCAVAVAPRGFRERPRRAISAIGVGVNGTAESDVALAIAAEVAAETGAGLRMLTAVASAAPFAPAYGYDWPRIEADNLRLAEQRLSEAATALAVPAETEAITGNAAVVLEAMSEHVDLIVVGSRGWGAFRSVVLGSTSDRLVHHAKCPVLVVPSAAGIP